MSHYQASVDNLIFFEEEIAVIEKDEAQFTEKNNGKWKILIVDDEKEVHEVTTMVLGDVSFDGKKLDFIHAYSGKEAEQILSENDDIAVVLLDVVMETDDAGLKVVDYIRNVIKNSMLRIILRTGQPGQAPEKKVILDFDINDYKEKTELTSQKLFTALIMSLRSYRDMEIIENNKKGLEDLISSSAKILKIQSMKRFATEVLVQLSSILDLSDSHLHSDGLLVTKEDDHVNVVAQIGEYAKADENTKLNDLVSEEVLHQIYSSFRHKKSTFLPQSFYQYFKSQSGTEHVIFLKGQKNLDEWDHYLTEIFCANISVSFDNIYLNEELEQSQREVIFTLGEIAETRSKETGFHVKRVAEYSKLLAMFSNISEEETEIIRLASSLHDIGKVGVSDDILNKPAELTNEEYEIIKSHAEIGYDMLKHSKQPVMKAAAIIALQHHEKYDGSGYPQGLKGEEIHIYGRITAIADVFDALSSHRVYKKAWEIDEIISYFRKERGKHFDPVLCDLLVNNIERFIDIKERYKDQKVF